MLRLAPKLTQRHIDLPAFSKMKVKRAAQVFSNTVQAAMLTYICSGGLPSKAFYTATFLKKVDPLFDIFNSSSLLDSKPFKCALKEGSPSSDFLKMMKSTFERLTVLGLKTQRPCMKGSVGVVTTETQNKELDIEYEQLISTTSTVNENALVYVAGYTCRTYLSKHSDCTNCSKL